MSIKRTRADFLDKLAIQIRALEVSAAGFDAGELWEAERLAAVAYNLFVDTRRVKSLLGGHLKIIDKINLFSSCRIIDDENLRDVYESSISLIPAPGFVMADFSGSGEVFVPVLDHAAAKTDPRQWKPFSEWWTETIFRSPDHRTINRKDLVSILRSQDGGSHIDENIDHQGYVALSFDPTPIRLNGEPLQEINLVVMRHVAWEIQISIQQQHALIFG